MLHNRPLVSILVLYKLQMPRLWLPPSFYHLTLHMKVDHTLSKNNLFSSEFLFIAQFINSYIVFLQKCKIKKFRAEHLLKTNFKIGFSLKISPESRCGSSKRGILLWVTISVAVQLDKQMTTNSALGGIARPHM